MSLDDTTYIDPRKCGLLVRWAIEHYGRMGSAIEAAEAVAVWLLASNEAQSELGETGTEYESYYRKFVQRAKQSRHWGDCPVAPSWLVAPITCEACVYEEYVTKALECLRIENGGVTWKP